MVLRSSFNFPQKGIVSTEKKEEKKEIFQNSSSQVVIQGVPGESHLMGFMLVQQTAMQELISENAKLKQEKEKLLERLADSKERLDAHTRKICNLRRRKPRIKKRDWGVETENSKIGRKGSPNYSQRGNESLGAPNGFGNYGLAIQSEENGLFNLDKIKNDERANPKTRNTSLRRN